MSSIVPSPPVAPDADATTRGVVNPTAADQTLGVGTAIHRFANLVTSALATLQSVLTNLVYATGATLVLRSSLGAGSSDVATKIGTSESDVDVNSAANLLVISTGIGGTETKKAYVLKSGAWQARAFSNTGGTPLAEYYAGATPLARLLVSPTLGGGVWYLGQNGGIADDSTQRVYFDPLGVRGGSVSIIGRSAVGATAIGAVLGTDRTQPDAARIASFRNSSTEKSAVMANGEFEHSVAGAGVVLRSPDGTRYRITVANGGTLTITAA